MKNVSTKAQSQRKFLHPPNCLKNLRSPNINNTKWLENLVDLVWTAAHTQIEDCPVSLITTWQKTWVEQKQIDYILVYLKL